MIEFLLTCILVTLVFIGLQIEGFTKKDHQVGIDFWGFLKYIIGFSLLIFGMLTLVNWILFS
jgi:hypothetical protein|tara:strand:+ start:362 stop:547 length:186 start_codon:yes stop_codon:yes gene_type:complete